MRIFNGFVEAARNLREALAFRVAESLRKDIEAERLDDDPRDWEPPDSCCPVCSHDCEGLKGVRRCYECGFNEALHDAATYDPFADYLPRLTPRETAAVLTGLRLLQQQVLVKGPGFCDCFPQFTDQGLGGLTADELEALCEKINCAPPSVLVPEARVEEAESGKACDV